MNVLKLGIAAGVLFTAAAFFLTAAYVSYFPDRSVSRGASVCAYTAYLDRHVPELMKRYDIPGATLAIVKDGKLAWTKGYGYADREEGRRLTADTPMRVQSISKSVTAWGIMALAEAGKIDLDAPVGNYIRHWEFPGPGEPANQATVEQLMSHTAGMPLGDVFTIYSPKETIPSLKESLTNSAIPFRKPGEGFFYSNVGYNILELLAEEVTGRDFAEYMDGEVLKPLGMKGATFVWSKSVTPPLPKGYRLDGSPVPIYLYPEKASGGLLATAEDIAAFAIAGMPDFSQQGVLSRSGVERLYKARAEKLGIYSLVFDSYGLGFYTERLSSGERAVSHGGQGTGWMSHFHAVPETGDAIVILTNSQRSWPFIAGLLNGWSRWCGFSPPGMTRILLGECVLWALVGLIMSVTLVLTVTLIRTVRIAAGGVGDRRLLTPLRFGGAGRLRLVPFGVSLFILGGLFWCVSQKYLFLTAVFPTVSVWLGVWTGIFAAVLLISSFYREK